MRATFTSYLNITDPKLLIACGRKEAIACMVADDEAVAEEIIGPEDYGEALRFLLDSPVSLVVPLNCGFEILDSDCVVHPE